jgi:hypothetical protein
MQIPLSRRQMEGNKIKNYSMLLKKYFYRLVKNIQMQGARNHEEWGVLYGTS